MKTPQAVKSGDQWLIDGLECGEASAIEAFVDRFGGRIHRVTARLLGDPRDVEEVTQDVLMSRLHRARLFLREEIGQHFSRRTDRSARSTG